MQACRLRASRYGVPRRSEAKAGRPALREAAGRFFHKARRPALRVAANRFL